MHYPPGFVCIIHIVKPSHVHCLQLFLSPRKVSLYITVSACDRQAAGVACFKQSLPKTYPGVKFASDFEQSVFTRKSLWMLTTKLIRDYFLVKSLSPESFLSALESLSLDKKTEAWSPVKGDCFPPVTPGLFRPYRGRRRQQRH